MTCRVEPTVEVGTRRTLCKYFGSVRFDVVVRRADPKVRPRPRLTITRDVNEHRDCLVTPGNHDADRRWSGAHELAIGVVDVERRRATVTCGDGFGRRPGRLMLTSRHVRPLAPDLENHARI